MPIIKKKTILLVEDEVIIALMEKQQLENENYKVIHAPTGEVAIEIVKSKKESIDLILMDIDLGDGISGTEAAKEILKVHEIPILFLSSHTEKEIVEKTENITSYGYVVKNSSFTVLDASIKMAFKLYDSHSELINKEKKLTESEARLKEAQIAAKVGSWQTDLTTLNVIWSDETYNIFELDINTFKASHSAFLEFVHPEDRKIVDDAFVESFNTEFYNSIEHRIITFNGNIKNVVERWRIVHDAQGHARIAMGTCQDITDRIHIKESLIEKEQILKNLFESITFGIVYQNTNGETIYVNSAAEEILGLSFAQMQGKISMDPRWKAIYEDGSHFPGESHPISVALKYGETVKDVVHGIFHPKKNDYVWLKVTAIPEFNSEENKIYRAYAIFEDITERKLAEQEIKNLLKEKELILKEVHHRVKNNMNTIYGLLFLQSMNTENSDAKKVLDDAAGRVKSMTVLYDKLYRSENVREISIKDYFPFLIEEISSLFDIMQSVKITTYFDDFILEAKLVSSLGIIINEMITNSAKYAFIGRENNELKVIATKSEDRVKIIFEDNGIGISESITFENSKGFGMQLISMLVNQIKGTVSIERNSGTKFIIEFEA